MELGADGLMRMGRVGFACDKIAPAIRPGPHS